MCSNSVNMIVPTHRMPAVFPALFQRSAVQNRPAILPESGAIEVSDPIVLTVADDGKTFHLVAAQAAIQLPHTSEVLLGWTITVLNNVVDNILVSVNPLEYFSGRFIITGNTFDLDGSYLAGVSAELIITFDGQAFVGTGVDLIDWVAS